MFCFFRLPNCRRMYTTSAVWRMRLKCSWRESIKWFSTNKPSLSAPNSMRKASNYKSWRNPQRNYAPKSLNSKQRTMAFKSGRKYQQPVCEIVDNNLTTSIQKFSCLAVIYDLVCTFCSLLYSNAVKFIFKYFITIPFYWDCPWL